MTTGKTTALTRQTFVCEVMSLLFNMLSKLVIAFLPRSSVVQFSSVAQSCPTLCDPMNHSMPGLPVHPQHPQFTKPLSIELVMPFNHLLLCRPLLLPSIFPSIRVFSNELVLCIGWPNYWSFSFNISPSNEHPG